VTELDSVHHRGEEPGRKHWRHRLYRVVFRADTPAGLAFDIAVLAAILASVAVVVLDSVPTWHQRWGPWFLLAEMGFTTIFVIEYLVRLLCVRRPLAYATSFFGVVDLIALLPTLLALAFPGAHFLIDIRLLRLLRVFRVLKLTRYFREAQDLMEALSHARRKIMVFVCAVSVLVVILGTVMYVVEGPTPGFESIPAAMYWAVVTMTTTGYGDITPQTVLGKFITSVTILLGYGIIALPTGIVGAEMAVTLWSRLKPVGPTCPACGHAGTETDARFCPQCGQALANETRPPTAA
jgi:voltage-gated potassium channel